MNHFKNNHYINESKKCFTHFRSEIKKSNLKNLALQENTKLQCNLFLPNAVGENLYFDEILSESNILFVFLQNYYFEPTEKILISLKEKRQLLLEENIKIIAILSLSQNNLIKLHKHFQLNYELVNDSLQKLALKFGLIYDIGTNYLNLTKEILPNSKKITIPSAYLVNKQNIVKFVKHNLKSTINFKKVIKSISSD